MTREEILKDPEVAHYCDAKRGWVHEAFMDGVDYAERKMKPQIKWQKGEPKKDGRYLVTTIYGHVATAVNVKDDLHYKQIFKEYIKAWCSLDNIEPYNEKQP